MGIHTEGAILGGDYTMQNENKCEAASTLESVGTKRALHRGDHRRGRAQLEETTYGRDYAWRWGLGCTAWDLVICECVLFPEEIRPSNSVYRSTFTYHTHRRALNDIDTLSSPSPIMPQNYTWTWGETKKELRSLTKKWREKEISPFPSFSLSPRSFLPKWDAFSISNLICTNDQAKRVCGCVGYLRWKWVGPLGLVGWGSSPRYARIYGLNRYRNWKGWESREEPFSHQGIWSKRSLNPFQNENIFSFLLSRVNATMTRPREWVSEWFREHPSRKWTDPLELGQRPTRMRVFAGWAGTETEKAEKALFHQGVWSNPVSNRLPWSKPFGEYPIAAQNHGALLGPNTFLGISPVCLFLSQLLGIECWRCNPLPTWSHPFQKDNTRFWENFCSVSLRTSSKLSSEEEEHVEFVDGMSISSVNLDLRGSMLLCSLGFGDSVAVSGKMEEFFFPTIGIDLSVSERGGKWERVVVTGERNGEIWREKERERGREREGESETI